MVKPIKVESNECTSDELVAGLLVLGCWREFGFDSVELTLHVGPFDDLVVHHVTGKCEVGVKIAVRDPHD